MVGGTLAVDSMFLALYVCVFPKNGIWGFDWGFAADGFVVGFAVYIFSSTTQQGPR